MKKLLLFLTLFCSANLKSQEFIQIADLPFVLTDIFIDNQTGDYYYTLQQGYLLKNGDTIGFYPTWNDQEMGLLSVCLWNDSVCVNVSGVDTSQHIICGTDTILSYSYHTSPFSKRHRGGELVPTDNKLYIATGYGAVFTDSQDTTNYRGKIISIDTSGEVNIEVFGLRNPWKFDYIKQKDFYFIADVGWNDREEIDICTTGVNLGWPCWEGTLNHPEYSCDTTVQGPVYEYEHMASGVSITGGKFYGGRFFFTDLYSGVGGAMYINGTVDSIQYPEQVTAMDIDSIMNALIVADFYGGIYMYSLDSLPLSIDSSLIPIKPKPKPKPHRIVPYGTYLVCDGYIDIFGRTYEYPPYNMVLYDCKQYKLIYIVGY